MKSRLIACLLGGVLAALAPAGVLVPPGYYLVNLSTDPGSYNTRTDINNRGQIVWSSGSDPFDGATYEIMLFDKATRQTTQITHNDVYDQWPSINDEGVIVWSSAVGPGGVFEIAMWRDGVISYLTDESVQASPANNQVPQVNNQGHAVWRRRALAQCNSNDSEVWYYDGAHAAQLTKLGFLNDFPVISEQGQIAWTHVNYCGPEVHADVYLLQDGKVGNLTSAHPNAGVLSIAASGAMPWTVAMPNEFGWGLELWNDGRIESITDWGQNGYISPDGQRVAFIRWFESNQTWQEFVWHDGRIKQVTNDPFWNIESRINDQGEMAWTYGTYPYFQTRTLLRRNPGDLNCDGAITTLDIGGFVLALALPAGYSLALPDCDRELADLNLDGQLTVADIGAFVAVLTQPR